MFQAAHLALSEAYDEVVVVSLNGFSQEGISASDETTGETWPGSVGARFSSALAAELPEEIITTCNAFDGAVWDARLCGTTNVQGRHLNGSLVACTEAASRSTERFIHVEQSLDVRRGAADSVVRALALALEAPGE